VRYLKELRLWEGSLVTFPMNEAAVVTSVKAFSDVEDLIRTADPNDPEVQKHVQSLDAVLKKVRRKDETCACPCPACVDGDCGNCDYSLCVDTNCEGHTDEDRMQSKPTDCLGATGAGNGTPAVPKCIHMTTDLSRTPVEIGTAGVSYKAL
jgi:hypothetical protein